MPAAPTIIETTAFSRFRDVNLTEEDLRELQNLLIAEEDNGTPIQGSGGLLIKTRFGVGNRGKRGGVRVIYARLRSSNVIYLLLGYPKNAESDLTPSQVKTITKIVEDELME